MRYGIVFLLPLLLISISLNEVYATTYTTPEGETVRVQVGTVADTTCKDGSTKMISSAGTGIRNIIKEDTADAALYSCDVVDIEFDLSAVGDNVTIINATLQLDINSVTNGINCDVRHQNHTSAYYSDGDDFYDEIINGTQYVANDSFCTTTGTNKTVTFSSEAYTDIQNALVTDLFNIGLFFNDVVRDASVHVFQIDNSYLILEYIVPPDAVDDLTYANLGSSTVDLIWTEPGLNGGNVTNYLINYTTPFGDPQTFLANSTNLYYNVTGLVFGTDYSFRTSVLTEVGYNATGNILNITTPTTTYSTLAPTSLTVNDCYHTCTTQLNLEWLASAMDNINGYRIFMETPVGGGWSVETANTTTTTLYYNDTSLTAGTFYNYKVASLNGSGISGNSSAYAYSPHKLPDAVDDLVITTNDLLQFLGEWTAPTLYGTLTGYQVNYTTPAGDPQTIYTSTNPDTDITISGLDPTIEHSFRVSPVTNHGINATGNIENATLTIAIEIGNLDLSVQTNPDVIPIWFELFNVDNSTDDVQVRFDSALTVDCVVTDRLTNTDTTYTGLSETAATGYVYHNFTVTNAGNAILDWDCYDQTDSTLNGQYTLTRNAASSGVGGVGNVPLFAQMSNFTAGLYGTDGELAGIDLITMFIVIVSMLGFNRYNPAVGVGVMATFLGAAWYFELIPWTSGAFGAIALVVVLAIGQGMKNR